MKVTYLRIIKRLYMFCQKEQNNRRMITFSFSKLVYFPDLSVLIKICFHKKTEHFRFLNHDHVVINQSHRASATFVANYIQYFVD